MCVVMENFVKLGQSILEILQFLDFKEGRHPPSSIFNFYKLICG